jgi:hypothetical protein
MQYKTTDLMVGTTHCIALPADCLCCQHTSLKFKHILFSYKVANGIGHKLL